MAWITRKKLTALQERNEALESNLAELKGYYENNTAGERNKYFASIASLLTGNEIADVFNSIDRNHLKECYESCGPAFGIINKIAALSKTYGVNFIISISMDEHDLPESCKQYVDVAL